VDLRDRVFPIPEAGIGARAMRSGKAVIVDERLEQDEKDAITDSIVSEGTNVSTVVAPVGMLSDCLGLIYAFRLEPPPFSRDQLEPLVLLRSLIGSEITGGDSKKRSGK